MTTGTRRRMTVEERRRQLVGVALELFSRRAPDQVSLEEIAAAAGISRPLVYHYFPGKLSLYEAAVRRAAQDLTERFAEPRQGPLGDRLLRVMRRFFDFADAHGPGLSTLLRGVAGVTGPDGSGAAMVDSVVAAVRRAAYEQVLLHLQVAEPPPRLDLVIRSWIALVESTTLLWLDERRMARAEVERQLVHDFGALVVVAAAHDEEMARLVERLFADEPTDGVFGELAGRVAALVPTAS